MTQNVFWESAMHFPSRGVKKACQIILIENSNIGTFVSRILPQCFRFFTFCPTAFSHPQTPMNQASTRSHCIFTVHLCRREPGSATLLRSKLHLVDLAGSDRVSKTGLDGQLLTDAKYINLSLHYLEQVDTFLYFKYCK